MERDISQVPIATSMRNKLYRIGFSKIDYFKPSNEETLSRELGISMDEAHRLVEKVRGYGWQTSMDLVRPITAFEMLRSEDTARYISTGSTHFDSILGGGVELGRITEISGVPGTGKTQICMQLCVNVQLPVHLQGIGGEAVFIDTEGSFTLDRVKDMAQRVIQQASSQHGVELDYVTVDMDTIMKRIFYVRCHEYSEVIATVHLIAQMLNDNDHHIKLVVIDNIAAPFRYAFNDIPLRSKILNGLMQLLVKMALDNSVAVVVINQMTTRITLDKESQLIPALGTSWGHSCSTRINLWWKNEERLAFLFKSPSQPENTAPYTITCDGISDASRDQKTQSNPNQDGTMMEEGPGKDATLLFFASQFARTETEPDLDDDNLDVNIGGQTNET